MNKKIKASFGYTAKLGNYESVRMDATIEEQVEDRFDPVGLGIDHGRVLSVRRTNDEIYHALLEEAKALVREELKKFKEEHSKKRANKNKNIENDFFE